MPIDTSIIPTKQTQPNFGAISDTLAQLMGFQKNQLGIQQAQQGLAANQAVSQALKQNVDKAGNINYPAIIRALSQDPNAAINLPEMAGKLYQTQNAELAVKNSKLDNLRKMADNLMPIAVDWKKKGEKVTRQDIQNGFAKAISMGAISPELALTHFGTLPEKDEEIRKWVDQEVTHLSNAQTAMSMITPGFQSNVGGNQPGFVNPFNQTITPATYAPAAPTAPAPVGVNTPKEPAALNQPEAKLELKYPKRAAGDIAPRLPEEAADTDAGQKFVNSLVGSKLDLATANRNVDEVIAKARKLEAETAKVPGKNLVSDVLNKGIRNIHNWANDPDYVQMSKDLANVQLSNMKAQGGDMGTDAGKALMAHANGTAVYPPEVLIDIASRAKAELRNTQMQATAAEKFAKRHGYNNMNSFKELWGNHADSKLFEMMNLHENKEMSQAEKLAKRNELMGITPQMSEEEKKARRSDFARKNAVLEKLVNTGGL